MSTYAQILSSTNQGRRQLWLIHGPDQALVQDAYELAKGHVYSISDDVTIFVRFGRTATSSDILQILADSPISTRTLIVLFDAEQFGGWAEISDHLRKIPRTHFFIAVCNEELAKDSPILVPFKGSAKARNVLCRSFTGDEAMDWVKSCLTIQDGAARYLVEHSKGDFEWLQNEVKKISLLRTGIVTLEHVEQLCRGFGSPNLEDSVLNYHKRDAILSIQRGDFKGVSVSRVLSVVRKSALINESTRVLGFFSVPRINDRTKLHRNDIVEYRPLSRLYDRSNTQRCIQACLRNFDKLQGGDRRRWLSLVSKW